MASVRARDSISDEIVSFKCVFGFRNMVYGVCNTESPGYHSQGYSADLQHYYSQTSDSQAQTYLPASITPLDSHRALAQDLVVELEALRQAVAETEAASGAAGP